MTNTKMDTGRALLPALPSVNAQDPSLRTWIKAVTERLEVREGVRGNPFERAVTVREIKELTEVAKALKETPAPDGNTVSIQIGNGLSASVAIDKFVASIRETRLHKDLMKRLDDPTRFDDVVKEVRDLLLTSITDEAKKRGADIRRLDTLIQDANRSLAYAVQEITAALSENAAGVREVSWAFADRSQAQAGKITQLEASLGNYYADGSPGRANLEQQMLVSASHTEGLRAQYTLKVQAGGALAGFGIAAEEANGVPSSAFIISADKFAIVSPNYSGGMTPSPNANHIPFGVDANGIYLNNNVYARGSMIIDTPQGRKPLGSGLRGSLDLSGGTGGWSDYTARYVIWVGLGNGGSPPDNAHLVIGDRVTMGSGTNTVTKYWAGYGWQTAGVVINGNLLVDGTVAAGKINARGLSILDASGNVILSAGAGLTVQQRIAGLGALASQNSLDYSQVGGAKPPPDATRGAVIGSNVRFPDGTTMQTTDFVNKLAKIGSANISSFMDSAAIGNAYIGNAAITSAKIGALQVDTLNIADNAVTVPGAGQGEYSASVSLYLTAGTQVTVMGTFTQGGGKNKHGWYIHHNGVALQAEAPDAGTLGAMTRISYAATTGIHSFGIYCSTETGDGGCGIVVLGTKK